ncbi:hypothetical protein C8Q80DRAFT_1154824 [Daedaleopsis nitida]|nr:hypothetical protein C8Q80DRAFT_1154824 [Daedaleopsis nitida]
MAKSKSTPQPKTARTKHPANQISQSAKGKRRASGRRSRKTVGWNLFLQAFHRKIKRDLEKAEVNLTPPPATAWSRYIGDAWNSAPQEIRDYFEELATAVTEQRENAERAAAAEEVEEVEDEEAWEVESEEGVDAEQPDHPLTIKLPVTTRVVRPKDSEGIEDDVDDAWSSSSLSSPPNSPVPVDHPLPGPSTSHTSTTIRHTPMFAAGGLGKSTLPPSGSRDVPIHPSLSFAQSPLDTWKWP